MVSSTERGILMQINGPIGFRVLQGKPRQPEDPEGLLDHSEPDDPRSDNEERGSATEEFARTTRRQLALDSADSKDKSQHPLKVQPQSRTPAPASPGTAAPGPSRRNEETEEVVQLD